MNSKQAGSGGSAGHAQGCAAATHSRVGEVPRGQTIEVILVLGLHLLDVLVERVRIIIDRRPRKHTLHVAERLEANLAVVAPNPGLSDATEAEVTVESMHQHIVDADGTRRRLLHELARILAVLVTKVIDDERLVFAVHVVDGLLNVTVGLHWQDGPEDLLLHQL